MTQGSSHENIATEKQDVYARVTSQIVAAIESGVSSWKMPWNTSGRDSFSPINVASRKPYRGINAVCLWAAANTKNYESGEWGTYRQFQDHGAQVRKGEKATTVVFWKFANEAVEELIAELGASFVASFLGLSTEPRPDHASYIQSWLKVLKADKRAIFTASSKATTGDRLPH
jgi:antirestriction protein ArdC